MAFEYPWFASYETGVAHTLSYPDVPITSFLTEAADAYPDRPAIRFMGATVRYRDLLAGAYRFAQALASLGVKPGDRVALMLPNVPQYVIAYYGVLFARGVVVQTNPLYVERELATHLRDAGAKVIVCLDLVFPRVRKVRNDAGLQDVIVTSVRDYLPPLKKALYPLAARRNTPRPPRISVGEAHDFVRLLLKAAPERPQQPEPDADELAVLQYTGGTTGTPKGVMLTHRNLVANVLQCQAWMYRNKQAGETIMAAVPLFHVYGMTVCMNYAMRMAACLVLIPRFDAGLLLKQIDRERPTLFPGAPTMYIALLNHPRLKRYDLSSINCCISGSASLPLHVKLSFEKLSGGKLVEGFGLSEASPVTHVNPIWGRSVPGSIGIPLPDTQARIVEPYAGGGELGPHEVGELAVKGPQVMKGYWNRSAETADVLEDGWLRTGDMAYRDEEGYFYIVDRKKDMINASGLKVYPREVEEVLYAHPAVLEAAVIGVPDDYRGETVKAFIVLKAGENMAEESLIRFCRERLAPYKVPRQIEFRDSLPKTIVGKTLRRVLAEEEQSRLRGDETGPPPGRDQP